MKIFHVNYGWYVRQTAMLGDELDVNQGEIYFLMKEDDFKSKVDDIYPKIVKKLVAADEVTSTNAYEDGEIDFRWADVSYEDYDIKRVKELGLV